MMWKRKGSKGIVSRLRPTASSPTSSLHEDVAAAPASHASSSPVVPKRTATRSSMQLKGTLPESAGVWESASAMPSAAAQEQPRKEPERRDWDGICITVSSAIHYIRFCHQELPSCGSAHACKSLLFQGNNDKEAWMELLSITVAAARQGKSIPFSRFDEFPWAIVHFIAQYLSSCSPDTESSSPGFFSVEKSIEIGALYHEWNTRVRVDKLVKAVNDTFGPSQRKVFVRTVLLLNWLYTYATPLPVYSRAEGLGVGSEAERADFEPSPSDELLLFTLVDLFQNILFSCTADCTAQQRESLRDMLAFLIAHGEFIFPSSDDVLAEHHEDRHKSMAVGTHEKTLIRWAEAQVRNQAIALSLMETLEDMRSRSMMRPITELGEEFDNVEMELKALSSMLDVMHDGVAGRREELESQLRDLATNINGVECTYAVEDIQHEAGQELESLQAFLSKTRPSSFVM